MARSHVAARRHWNFSGVTAVNPGKYSDRTATMRSPYLLATLPLLLLTGCPDGRYDDRGYGVRDPAVMDREREAVVSDLKRSCREGDRQSCAGLDRAIEQQRREERYEGPQPSLSERNRDQQRRDQERREEKQRRLEQRPDDLWRR
jgi:hypothetical protein